MGLIKALFGLHLFVAYVNAVHDADVLNLYKHQFTGDVSTVCFYCFIIKG